MNKASLQSLQSRIAKTVLPVDFLLFGSETVYTGAKTVLSQDVRYSDYGSLEGYAFSLYGTIGDFTTLPKEESKIIVDTVTYRILSIDTDSADAGVIFHLGDLLS